MRIDRERARRLSDAQVIDAYGRVFPESVGRLEGLAAAARAQRIAVWRERLWNVSWYMRCLNEWIARQANREDGCTGRFWEGRFRSQALLDAGAVLTCMCYVDLNPLRAGVAETLEAADFTSIQERLLLAGEREQETRAAVFPRGALGGELVPFADEAAAAERSGPGSHQPLPMRFADYVGLLQETVRAIRDEKGAELTPGTVRRVEAVGLNAVGFVETVREFGRRFFTMVGEVHRIDTESRRRGYRRRRGIEAARRLYRQAA